jgi:hypothetical protein
VNHAGPFTGGGSTTRDGTMLQLSDTLRLRTHIAVAAMHSNSDTAVRRLSRRRDIGASKRATR